MTWRDAIFSVGSIVFIVALIPMLRGRDKPAVSSSALTGSWLLAYGATYASMRLWYSAVTTTMLGLCWLTLAFQAFKRGTR